MKTIDKVIASALVALLVTVFAFIFLSMTVDSPAALLGSVARGGEYQATSTVAMGDNKHQLIQGDRPTILGSIVVASSSATTIKIWNATSTTDVASTTLGTIKAAAGEQTFVFDAILTRGLILEIPTGFNGNYIVTFR